MVMLISDDIGFFSVFLDICFTLVATAPQSIPRGQIPIVIPALSAS